MLQGAQDSINAPGSLSAVVRGCADDIGAALASYKLLRLLKPAFDKAFLFAGLRLNDIKCTLVPLCFADFRGASNEIRQWLSVELPDWQGFSIQESGKYLGMWIGPSASDKSWDKPLKNIGSGWLPLPPAASLRRFPLWPITLMLSLFWLMLLSLAGPPSKP